MLGYVYLASVAPLAGIIILADADPPPPLDPPSGRGSLIVGAAAVSI